MKILLSCIGQNSMIPVLVFSVIMIFQQSVSQPTPYTWKSVVVGCGGYVSGIVYHPTVKGLKYARTDIGGAYRWDASVNQWTPLNDQLTIKNVDVEYMGVLSIALDRNDTNRVYMECGGYTESWAQPGAMFSSTDKGRTWTIRRLPMKIGGNEDGRGAGERLQVDPHMNSILFMGTTADGLWKSTDFAVSWTRVASFTSSNVNFVLFDPSTGSSGKATQRLFVGTVDTTGKSFYRSDDAGATWTMVKNQPTGAMVLRAAFADSLLYLACSNHPGPNGATGGSVWKYNINNGNWKNVSPSSGSYGFAGISAYAKNSKIIMASTLDRWMEYDEIYLSTNGGASWTPRLANAVMDCSLANYAKPLNHGWISCAEFDPFDSSKAMFVTGYGMYASENIFAAVPTWSFRNENVEETQVFQIVSPPYTKILSAMGDIDGFRHDTLDVSPPDKFSPARWTSTSIAIAENAPLKVVKTYNSPSWVSTNHGAYSLDGAVTWHDFATIPVGASDGGVWSIALSVDGTTIVWGPLGSAMSYSTNNGNSWTACTGGVPLVPPVADRVNAKKFYAYDGVNGQLWVSSDAGASFHKGVGNLPVVPNWLPQDGNVTAVPGHEGDLWICTGDGGLYRSINSGGNAVKISSVSAAYRMGLGASATPGGYHALYLYGTVNGALGFFRSDDFGASWTRINDDAHQYGKLNQITGDPQKYGRCYITPVGRGIQYGDPLPSGTSVVKSHSAVVSSYSLGQNFPNPFNPSTTIAFTLPQGCYTTLKMFNTLGVEVASLVSEELPAGTYERTWDASAMPSGAYFYQLRNGLSAETKKLMILR